jgi:diguanylate cyclase (GGDEF)-like protein/PAS domain S-box-containing protein
MPEDSLTTQSNWQRFVAALRTKTVLYGLYGALFGLLFPVGGMLFEIVIHGEPFTFDSFARTHAVSPVFWFVDTAPIVLGYLASIVGKREDHLAKMAAELEEQVEARTQEYVRQHRLFEALFQSSPLPIVALDAAHLIFAVNPAFEEMFGFSQAEILGGDLDTLITTNDSYEQATSYTQMTSAGQPLRGAGIRARKDGSTLEVEIFGMPVVIGDEQIGVFAIYTDVTERRRAEEALKESEARYRSLFEDSPISLWEEDFSEVKHCLNELRSRGITNLRAYFERNPEELTRCASLIKVTNVNEATLRLFEATSKEELTRNLVHVLDDAEHEVLINEFTTLINGATHFDAEISQRTLRNNTILGYLRLTIAPGSEETWDKVFVSIIDITERKQLEDKLRDTLTHTESLARTDVLTGSLNRRAIMEQARAELARAGRERTSLGLAIVDMDFLKEVNDKHGHLVGDAALRLLAVTLEKASRLYDRVGRWGGDEFLVVLPNIEPQSVLAIADRLILRVNESTLSMPDGPEIRLSICIGVSASQPGNDEGIELEELLRQADAALMQAKNAGRNTVRSYLSSDVETEHASSD